MTTNLDEISEIVIWWRDLPYHYDGLADLMNARQRLSGYVFGYAEEIAKLRKSWSDSQTRLEIAKNQKRVQFLDSGTTKADYMARANIKTEFDDERTGEALYYGSKVIYDAAIEVLGAMAQRIAHLREEWKLKQYQSG